MCKKLFFMLVVLAVAGIAVPASAADPNYSLAGSWNGWTPRVDMMTEGSPGELSGTLTGLTAGSRQTFKVVKTAWNAITEVYDETWIPGSSGSGSDAWLYADGAGAVTVGLNTNTVSDGWLTATNRIGLSTDGNSVGWTIAGSFGWGDNDPDGAGLPDWSTTGLPMTDMGCGIYELTLALPSGSAPGWTGDPTFNTYAWKAVVTGTWDSISEDGRGVNTANALVTVSPGQEKVTFYLDSYTGVVYSEVIPEPATMVLLGLGLALIRRKR